LNKQKKADLENQVGADNCKCELGSPWK
jgi:hypothetical protein